MPRSLLDVFSQGELLLDKLIYVAFLKKNDVVNSITLPILYKNNTSNALKDKIYTYLPADTSLENFNPKKSILVFRNNHYIDSISAAKYLSIIQNENVLVRDRERITERAAKFYSKYRYNDTDSRLIY